MHRMLKPFSMLMPMPIIAPSDMLQPQTAAQPKEPARQKLLTEHLPKKARSGLAGAKRHAIRMARRKHAMKKATKLLPVDVAFCHIYVGQIDSRITVELLTSCFEDIGLTVKRVQIRCSVGQAVVANIPQPIGISPARDRQYATVEFYDPKSAKKALRMNGAALDGCTLLVTPSVLDLPEASEIVGAMRRTRPKAPGPMPVKSRLIQPNPTELDLTPDKNWFMGLSFAKCVM